MFLQPFLIYLVFNNVITLEEADLLYKEFRNKSIKDFPSNGIKEMEAIIGRKLIKRNE